MRIVTFNIRTGRAPDITHNWWRRRKAVLAVLQELEPDVIALQEAFGFQLEWLARRLPNHTAMSTGRGRCNRGERCALLIGESLRIRCQATRWYGDTPITPGSRLSGASFPRIATTVELADGNDGDWFRVANTHLDEKHPANRSRSIDQLIDWVATGPRIVVGDLNAEVGDAELANLHESGMRPALAADAGGTAHRFKGGDDGPSIDHVFVSSHWTVDRAFVDRTRPQGRLPSDHWPVVVDLHLEQAAPRG